MAANGKVLRFTEENRIGQVRGKDLPTAIPSLVNPALSHETLSKRSLPGTSTEYTKAIKLPQDGSNWALSFGGPELYVPVLSEGEKESC